MKTTIKISDALLHKARKLADRERVNLCALFERGLRRIVDQASLPPPFRLRPASFPGEGMQPDAPGASWDRMRDLTYEGQGAGTFPS